jgi:serine protease Do
MRSCLALLSFILIASACAIEQPDKGSTTPADDPDPDIALAQHLERGFQKLAKRIGPSVVSLQVNTRRTGWSEQLRPFGEHSYPDHPPQGSGVIVDQAGWIVTNEHVVRDAESVTVTFSDGRSCQAEITGIDARSDLAMLKVKGEDAPASCPCAQLADSDKVQVGQYAMAVGSPFGLANSVTFGVISARGRNPRQGSLNDVFYGNLIQTDAPINPGNSGGPLFDLSGKVIGINTMIYSTTGVSQACGFAIPSNQLKPRLELLKVGREVEYGWLGVQPDDLAAQKLTFKVPDNKGVLVSSVIANTPADRAGLTHGMIILEVDGNRIGTKEELIGAVGSIPVGRVVKVKVLNTQGVEAEYNVRISKRYSELAQLRRTNPTLNLENMSIDLDELEANSGPAAVKASAANGSPAFVWRGMQFKELSAADARRKGGQLEIVRVKKGSPADRAGLYEGAVIAELKHAANPAIQKLTSLDAFKKLAAPITGPASLYVPLDGYITVDEK